MGAGAAEAAGEGVPDRRLRLLDRVGDGDSLARRQAIGLHHQRPAHLGQHRQGIRFAGHRPMAGGGHPGLLHQLFGPGLAGLQLRPLCPWTEHGDAGLPQGIGHPSSQRGFRTHHDQINRMRLAMGDQGGAVGLLDGEGLLVTAGVAWGDPDSFNGVMALQGPAQGVFAAATTNDEHPPQVGQDVGTGGRDGHGGKPERRGLVGSPL